MRVDYQLHCTCRYLPAYISTYAIIVLLTQGALTALVLENYTKQAEQTGQVVTVSRVCVSIVQGTGPTLIFLYTTAGLWVLSQCSSSLSKPDTKYCSILIYYPYSFFTCYYNTLFTNQCYVFTVLLIHLCCNAEKRIHKSPTTNSDTNWHVPWNTDWKQI